MREKDLLRPDWPAPEGVGALSTTRRGGVSRGPWESLNLSLSCGDKREDVLANRERLSRFLPAEPMWIRQVHGSRVLDPPTDAGEEADAAVSSARREVLAVLSADCLPVLLCDDRGRYIGVAHAGWRGLAAGVIEATVERMRISPGRLIAWLGPAIGGEAYEVGGEVREAFAGARAFARLCPERAFIASGDRWRLDVAEAARVILAALGVERVYGGGFCTFGDPERFFSHRRDGVTGRMATMIWLE